MKRRIFFGLAPLFILLIAMGLYAVTLFTNLGNRVDVILRENFRSVLAGQQMKETAERMDSALSFSLVGEEERGRKLYAQNLPGFRENLRIELDNITLPGEAELAAKVKQLHEKYAARAEAFWATPDIEARRKMYFGEMLPVFTEIKDTAQEIIRINQDNMVQADREARRLAAKSTRYMIFAIAAGIGGAIFFALRLQRSILRPIRQLTTVSKELGEGKLDQVVPVASQDELGQLADTFNKMATKLRAYRQVMGDQILQARQMTEITFSAFPDPIIALTSDGRIDFTNPAATKFLYHCGHADSLPASVQAEVDRVFKGAPDFLPTSFERVIVFRVEGHEVFMLPRVIGMRDESGNIFGAAVILQDVTRLRLLDEVKTNLVSTVSHELKTPLTSVRMGLHLLLEERIGPLNNKQTELLLAAREDSERLLRMINDLLDLAKLESGKAVLPSEVIEPGELVQSAGEDLRGLVESRGSRLVTKTEPDLPRVFVDAQQISHVFSNFVSNAIKHTRAGEEIVLGAKKHNDTVRFSVIDHGSGIAAKYRARIFDRFFRVPGAEVTGAGLGLAIAREIVLAQGGTIGVNSTPGQGSEFYFDLPPARNGASS
ncbi:MAG TPA: ATP-binding protein [Chthoniobacterales bacterium]|nr:ATP-binding protein [Chthoniobacterales bacterium]